MFKYNPTVSYLKRNSSASDQDRAQGGLGKLFVFTLKEVLTKKNAIKNTLWRGVYSCSAEYVFLNAILKVRNKK